MSDCYEEVVENPGVTKDLAREWESTREELRRLSAQISGWEFDERSANNINLQAMSDTLIAMVKERESRINSLVFKLGLLVEKTPC